ncbi:MAG TPA: oligoendopeptidase F [Chloroflexota bacterium]|nr:oligoendopeptidase F [Chloroflexota bacterium]
MSETKDPDSGCDNTVSRRQLLKGIGCLAAGTALLPVLGNQENALAQTVPGDSVAATHSPAATAPPAVTTPAPATAAPVTQQVSTLPDRRDIAPEYTWSLEDIYADADTWEADFQRVRESIPQLEQFKDTLRESPRRLLDYLSLRDDTSNTLDRVYVYANMKKDEDNTNGTYQALADRAAVLGADLGKATAFFSPELLAMPDETLEAFLATEPGLEIYRHALDDLRRQRPHVRTTEVEEVLAQASEMARAAGNSYTMLAEADIKFPSILDEQGRTVDLTQSRYSQFRICPDRRVRKEAFQGIHQTFEKFRNSFASTYSSQVKADIFAAKTRRYGSCLESALADDNVSADVYHNLIDTVTANLPTLHRYLALRKRLLGLSDLHFYDLYVPMVPGVKMEIPYQEATSKVVEALHPLGQEYVDALSDGINSRWIDVYENEGKTSGAYSWGSYSTHPYILLNYQGTLNDVLTLAHELGHAMHSYFRTKSQPYVYGGTSIFVAEVASILNEVLLADYLAKTTNDRRLQAYLINQRLEGLRGTLYRQTMFAEFELEAHSRAEAGVSLTADRLSAIYGELSSKSFGDVVAMDNEIAIEWAVIPHFYTPFYVYKYATGISAATALAQSILTEGEPAVEAYLNLLKAGTSKYPLDLLRDAGVDMASPAPIQKALDSFSDLIDQLESLTA